MDKRPLTNKNATLPPLPDYNNCLVNLANSILKKFGAGTLHGTLALADRYLAENHKNVVILLLDALGTSILEKHLDTAEKRDHLYTEYITLLNLC
ncbi:MAG: hypothetical protein J5824_07735 [Lachnospiraceae bacterium]|nr:hypothetical protein [Lachnospiraceae bacterium]